MSVPPTREQIADPRVRVLIVGDAMLDRYWFGSVERISPEAPVPVVRVNRGREQERLGGAANVVDSSFIESNFNGFVRLKNQNLAKDGQGRNIAMGRTMSIVIVDQGGKELAHHKIVYGARLLGVGNRHSCRCSDLAVLTWSARFNGAHDMEWRAIVAVG